MNFRHPLASALQLFVVFAFFSAGLFFFALPFLPEVLFELSDIFLNRTDVFAPLGISFFVVAFLLLIAFGGLNRGRILYVEMGTHTLSVEEALIRHSLEECFKLHFSQKMQLSEVEILWGKKLEIQVLVNALDLSRQKEILMEAEKHLQLFLRQRFGYIKPFSLILKSKT